MKKAMVILMRFRDIDDSLDVIEYSDSCIQVFVFRILFRACFLLSVPKPKKRQGIFL